MLTHPKSNYSNDYIWAPRGRCRLKFVHALENDQGFLAHTPLGWGSPQQFLTTNIGLKVGGMQAYNFGVRGRNLTKLLQVTYSKAGMIKWGQFFGALPPLEFGRAKTVQNLVRFCATSHFDHEYLRNG